MIIAENNGILILLVPYPILATKVSRDIANTKSRDSISDLYSNIITSSISNLLIYVIPAMINGYRNAKMTLDLSPLLMQNHIINRGGGL
jgi:hypothetical protein